MYLLITPSPNTYSQLLPEQRFGWEIPWSGRILTLGRDIHDDIYIPARALSSTHANLYNNQSQLYLEDRGSTNGTYINGTRLKLGQIVRLSPGQIVYFATVSLSFRLSEQAHETWQEGFSDDDTIDAYWTCS